MDAIYPSCGYLHYGAVDPARSCTAKNFAADVQNSKLRLAMYKALWTSEPRLNELRLSFGIIVPGIDDASIVETTGLRLTEG